MKQKIVFNSFEASGFEPVVKYRKARAPRSGRLPEACVRQVTHNLSTLRRAWRALAQTPPLFVVPAGHE